MRQIRPGTRCVALLAVLAIAVLGHSQAPQLTPEQWREDARFFVSELARRHMNAYHAVSRADYEKAGQALVDAAPKLPPGDVVTKILEITALVGDGHTGIRFPTWFHRYPLVLQWFGDELRVTRAGPQAKAALGAKLVSIDGVPLDELRRKIARVVSQDENEGLFLARSAVFLGSAEILHGLGITRDASTAHFSFQPEEGELTELTLTAAPADPLAPLGWESASATTPLSASRPTETFWFERLPDSDVMYLCWRGYKDIGDKAHDLFEQLEPSGARRLLIDMRGNGGGDFNVGRRHVVNPALKRLKEGKLAAVYVAVGRRTFSAALANAIDLKKGGAVLLGEPIGEKPNSYSENNEFTLPNSKLVISYSSKYYKFWDTDVPAILPDRSLPPSWPEFRRGEDPVMKWVLSSPNPH